MNQQIPVQELKYQIPKYMSTKYFVMLKHNCGTCTWCQGKAYPPLWRGAGSEGWQDPLVCSYDPLRTLEAHYTHTRTHILNHNLFMT